MVRSPGFGSRKSDQITPYSDLLSLWLRIVILNQATSSKSPAHSSTGTRSDIVILPLFESVGFHVLFHSPTGVLFTFPSRYYFTIGHLGVFSLTRWSSLIHTGFHVPHATRDKQGTPCTFYLLLFTKLKKNKSTCLNLRSKLRKYGGLLIQLFFFNFVKKE